MYKIKQLIKIIIFSRVFAKFFIKTSLLIHNLSYILASRYAVTLNNGVHPKHWIMKYKEWFLGNIQTNWVVLDVGCNTGMMSEIMSSKADFVYGIDIEEKHIKEAVEKRQGSNIKFINADATCYDYTQLKNIDCVTLSNVLEHIEHRVEFLTKIINQIKWNNKKRLLIRVPMIDRDWIVLYKKEMEVESRLDTTHFTEYTYYQLKTELEQANVKIISYHVKFGEIYAICEGYE